MSASVGTRRQKSHTERALPPLPPPSSMDHSHRSGKQPAHVSRSSYPASLSRPIRLDVLTVSVLSTPCILMSLLRYLAWRDFISLAQTCRNARRLFDNPETKDAILARYVPYYSYALSMRDMDRFQDVHVTLSDLDLFLVSQQTPLHRYPTHALSQMSALFPSPEQVYMSHKLATLAEAHSRFVLILQSLVHSSAQPLPSEQLDSRQVARLPQPHVRELTFPAPLSAPSSPSPPRRRRESSEWTTPPSSYGKAHARVRSSSATRPRGSLDSRTEQTRSLKTKSLSRRLSTFDFGRRSPPPLPAPSEPKDLKRYSQSWRRTLYPAESFQEDLDDAFLFTPPRRRFTSENPSASSSSSSISKGSLPIRPVSRVSNATSPSTSASDVPTRTSRSPHDIGMAASRTRAPILRVFVPCSQLSEDDTGSITQCEEQLCESGLWNSLSTGDIVCNLGYVPPSDEGGVGSPSGSSSTDDELAPPPRLIRKQDSSRRWLIFDGHRLIPYASEDSPPLKDALELPSPFYYSHLGSATPNPSFVINRVPQDSPATMSLVVVSCKVRSPHSPLGYAVVRRHVWTARVLVGESGEKELGDGWKGEWVLEGEGTKEGRRILENYLQAGSKTGLEWRLNRDKSTAGRLWLKLEC